MFVRKDFEAHKKKNFLRPNSKLHVSGSLFLLFVCTNNNGLIAVWLGQDIQLLNQGETPERRCLCLR
eukprot:m.106300 g.106300  ORF g.106300 m.106300 type:complete len:67 (-) comp13297_c1_seq1:1661-1861(-)